jgi:hypothetical protein
MKSCFVNKLTTSTKRTTWVEWFDKRRSEKVGSGAHARTDVYSGYCSGLPLRIKEINMASMLRCTFSATL